MIAGIICKEGNPEALALSERVVRWMQDKGLPCLLEVHISDYLKTDHTDDVWKQSDILIAIGGDGTFLRAIRMAAPREIPVLGIHMGYLGFLTEVTEDEVFQALDALKAGSFIRDERTMLEVTLMRGDETVVSQYVLNDIVINKGALARIIDIEVWTDSTFITCYRADGLIISTPTGSTAYSLAAGGPIVHPQVSAIILNPICPHVLSNRSIVLPDSQEVIIIVKSGKASDNIYLTLDGQKGHPLQAGDKLQVKRGSRKVVMLRFPQRDYFEILRSKLKWQER
ncbi:MAG TPA: NAD(+)/NADH kinase [Desulfomonilia bacterium]|nr:NAD(+)/NADH kinase [Desulfomonilia bacterium]